MVLIIENGKVNNGHIVLSKPLSLPEGTEVRVQIEPVALTSVSIDGIVLPQPRSHFAGRAYCGNGYGT